METKEEISDTDSGIILHSGPDSPTTVMKDVSTHTRAVKLKQQSLEDRLELCILELKKICIREAELTGRLSSDYPLLPGEKPPRIRQRIGAAFKLDEQSLLYKGGEDSALFSVEAKLALQQQIYVAVRRLCQEEHLSKAVKKSRMQHCKLEEQKLRELQESLFQLRLEHGGSLPHPGIILQKHQGTSDDSSLSDSAILEEEELMSQSSHISSEPPPVADSFSVSQGTSYCPPNPTGLSALLQSPEPSPCQPPSMHPKAFLPCHSPTLEYEPSPIQNSPWKESSLDQPYQKRKKSSSNSTKSSPAVTPTLPPLAACLEEMGKKLQIPSQASLRHTQSSSAPPTPDMHLRRGYSLRVPSNELPYDMGQDRGRSREPRRRVTDVILASPSPEYSSKSLAMGNPTYQSSSEDSNIEHSPAPFYSSPCQDHLLDLQRLCQSQYTYHYPSPPDNYISQSYVPLIHYKNPSLQFSSSFYRGNVDEGRGHDLDMSRMFIKHQPLPSCKNGHYKYWYEEVQVFRPVSPHMKLSRAPSLREPSQHLSRGLPHQVVSEELKLWHKRSQMQPPRPCSLDRHRQGAVRFRNLPEQESQLSQQHSFQEQQVPQRQIMFETPNGTPIKWYEEDVAEIVSQV